MMDTILSVVGFIGSIVYAVYYFASMNTVKTRNRK